VQVLGGEAGRRLDQEQTEAIAAVLAWLAAHPPTAAAGSAATIDTPVGQSTATPAASRPASPSPVGSAGASSRGRAGAGARQPQAERSRPLRRAGQPGGWRVVAELPDSGSGPGAGAGRGGPAGGGGRPGAGRAPGGGAPLGLAGLA
jgi:translation initiation factor IF-2